MDMVSFLWFVFIGIVGYFCGHYDGTKKSRSTTMRERLEALPVAEKLEDLLNGLEPIPEEELQQERAKAREFALWKDSPDLRSQPAEVGSEARDVVQVQLDVIRSLVACSGLEDKQRLVLGLGAIVLEYPIRSTHTPPPPAIHTSQTSSRRTATQPDKPVSMAPGQTYRVQQHQTGSEASEGSSGRGISRPLLSSVP